MGRNDTRFAERAVGGRTDGHRSGHSPPGLCALTEPDGGPVPQPPAQLVNLGAGLPGWAAMTRVLLNGLSEPEQTAIGQATARRVYALWRGRAEALFRSHPHGLRG